MEDVSFDTARLDERGLEEVLTRPAVEFVAALHRRFDPRRVELLDARERRGAAIARGGQIRQWIRHGAKLDDGRTIAEPLVRRLWAEELARIEGEVGEETWNAGHPQRSLEVLEAVALGESFPDFLTLVAYDLLEGEPAR